ncbi:MAG TPA: glycosyltransferase family 4 protein [Opitutaceae bacterium]|jgi:glycosyltransferase involved in cell wall biosynthesis|nr:glycosyltransferase family 4 protein [Opitutaceae bacterium]
MKIAYFFHRDAENPSVQSGRPASILAELRNLGVEIEPVFPLKIKPSPRWLAKKILYRLKGRYYRWDREPEYLASFAEEFSTKMSGKNVDVIFSPGSEVVSRLQTDRPVTFCADATFANLVDYYEDFTNVSREYFRQGHRQEAAALARTALAVYPSDWAARSAIDFYGTDPDKVSVIPFGANFGRQNKREQVWRWIEDRPRSCLRLLFVGRHWQRKGGELVVATAQRLIQSGYRVELDVVGCQVPRHHCNLTWIRQHGVLNSGIPAEVYKFSRLFAGAHYVFVPSRAEAYGMIFAEGNAFGLPVVTTATGGIPSIVRDGRNGLLLPLSAPASDYAEAISASFANREQYQQLCRQAFFEFERRLNWGAFCRQYLERVAECCPRSGGNRLARTNS